VDEDSGDEFRLDFSIAPNIVPPPISAITSAKELIDA
jgi:hypothetical protein